MLLKSLAKWIYKISTKKYLKGLNPLNERLIIYKGYKMARTKKVGITGRFGARYGRKAKRSADRAARRSRRSDDEHQPGQHLHADHRRPDRRASGAAGECEDDEI